MDYSYIDDFKKLHFGLFVHYGLYSQYEKGEWNLWSNKNKNPNYNDNEYNKAFYKFNPKKSWAKDLCKVAKASSMRYITLTTRHHDGFSLYDTKGLSDFDSVHSFCKRDLVREFVDACHEYNLIPFFYHTVIDWQNPLYKSKNYQGYFEYLKKSIEILLTNYGEIGGIWFDGTWGLEKGITFPTEIYEMIHKLQPKAIITDNTGLNALGQIGGKYIDCVTFERGKPFKVDESKRKIAGEVCDSLTDHWGYAKDDINVKSSIYVLNELIDSLSCNVNLLLNVGPKKDGIIPNIQKETLKNVGYFIKRNKNILLNTTACDLKANNATILKDEKYYYALVKNVPMALDENVTRIENQTLVEINTNKKIIDPIYLDNKEKVKLTSKNQFYVMPFQYGTSLGIRIIRFKLK